MLGAESAALQAGPARRHRHFRGRGSVENSSPVCRYADPCVPNRASPAPGSCCYPRPLHATAVRRQAQAVAERLEDELGPEQPSFIDSCQRHRAALPRPDLPLLVSLDGGYVHSSEQRSRRDGWLNPDSEHLLDWFHVTMRLTVMTNMAKVSAPHHPTRRASPAGRPRRGGCRRPAAPQMVLLARQRCARPEHDQRLGDRRRGR
jgi:hypothetical protein